MSDIVERLREGATAYPIGWETITKELLNEAADEIERLREILHTTELFEAERKKNEWVSVNDRLPEEWAEVIACNENAVVYPQARWFFSRYDGRIWEWAYEAGMDYWVSMDVPVTHWMPLPVPPKGEEE